jgi:hypothetical protein
MAVSEHCPTCGIICHGGQCNKCGWVSPNLLGKTSNNQRGRKRKPPKKHSTSSTLLAFIIIILVIVWINGQ